MKPVLFERYDIRSIGLYSSYAKNLHTETSDVDIVIEMGKPLAWEFFDIQILLEDTFNKKVDLVTTTSLRPDLRESILKEAVFV